MPRLSKLIEKLSLTVEKGESRMEKKAGRWYSRHKGRLAFYIPLALVGWYVYGMFLNSLDLGIRSTFPKNGEVVEGIWVLNPFLNWLKPFTPFGLGVTTVCAVLICLITKKGYNRFSGYKFVRDKRGFDILPDGTHGTSGFMDKKERTLILDTGGVEEVDGTILGKLKADPDDDDKYAEYVTLKKNSGLTEHTMVYGATGAGKSRGFVKPFVLQCTRRKESLVLVDPKGELFESMSGLLIDQGYEVRLFNLLDMEHSDAWNCLRDTDDDPNLVQSIAEVIINNTSTSEDRQDFWSKAELNLLVALLHYVRNLRGADGKLLPIQQRSLGAVYRILSSESFQRLEEIFNALPKEHPGKAPYGIFKLANRQIWGNIAIGLGNRLAVFQNPLVDKITSYSEIDLTMPGRKPCAYFCAISDQDSSLEFLSSLFFSQLSDRYEKKEWEELIGNCDIQICLGCNDQMTAQYISDKCGQITIRVNNNQMPLMPLFSPVYTSTRPYSQTRSNTQRALMLPDEILRMDNRQCLVLLRGQKPMQLYKIIPDELPTFQQLRETTVREHTPIWRQQSEQPTAETIVPTPTPPASEPQLQMELETQYEYGLSDRTETDELGMVEKPLCEVLGDDEEDAT